MCSVNVVASPAFAERTCEATVRAERAVGILSVEFGCDARFEPPDAVDEPDGVLQRPVEFRVDRLPVIARALQFDVNGLRSIGGHFIEASEFRPEFRLPRIEPNL